MPIPIKQPNRITPLLKPENSPISKLDFHRPVSVGGEVTEALDAGLFYDGVGFAGHSEQGLFGFEKLTDLLRFYWDYDFH